MLLSDRDIITAKNKGRIVISPDMPEMIQPSSIDVILSNKFLVFDNYKYAFIDPATDQPDLCSEVEVEPDGEFVLHPGEFVLASTYEKITLSDDIASRFEGKSSLGRLGILTHITAGFIDPGFSGHITLELHNVANLPVKLYPGMKIGQLCFFDTISPAEHPYGSSAADDKREDGSGPHSHYQSQSGPTASRSGKNFVRIPLK
jgi:dCTP deaminase